MRPASHRETVMIVEGIEVSQEALDKCSVQACTSMHFTFGDVQSWLQRARVPTEACFRAADRLLQKWKKEGKIMFRKGQWHWQTGK